MPNKRAIKRLLPAGIVSSVVGLAFLLPAGPLAGALAFYGYGYATNYGGVTLAGSPDVAAPPGTGEPVFFEGTDRAAWYVTYDTTTGTFGGNTSLGGLITADPGAVAHGAGSIELTVRGSDNQTYQKRFDGASWSGWIVLGGILTTGPDTSLRGTAAIDLWVGGSDNQLYHKWSNDGGATWTNWQALGGILTSDARAVSWGGSANRVDVFVRGSDYQLYHKFWDISIGWSNWEALGGILTSAPDVASCQTGHLDVFVKGTNNHLWTKWWNGSSWSAWTDEGGNWTASPTAVCRSDGSGIIDVFERGTDNFMWGFQEPSH